MRLAPQDRQGRAGVRGENIVPMINVVFLLLIFFLMAAELAPPDPVDVVLPAAANGTAPTPGVALFLDAGGELAFEGARGAAALDLVQSRAGPDVALTIHADGRADAGALAAMLPQLSGFGSIALATVPE